MSATKSKKKEDLANQTYQKQMQAAVAVYAYSMISTDGVTRNLALLHSDIAKRYHGDHVSGTMAQKAAILDPSDDNFKYLWTQESSLGNCICEPFAKGQVLQ